MEIHVRNSSLQPQRRLSGVSVRSWNSLFKHLRLVAASLSSVWTSQLSSLWPLDVLNLARVCCNLIVFTETLGHAKDVSLSPAASPTDMSSWKHQVSQTEENQSDGFVKMFSDLMFAVSPQEEMHSWMVSFLPSFFVHSLNLYFNSTIFMKEEHKRASTCPKLYNRRSLKELNRGNRRKTGPIT